jgi:hypothetical protein
MKSLFCILILFAAQNPAPTAHLLDWYHRLTTFEKFGVWGTLATFAGLIVGLTPWVRTLARIAWVRFNRNKLPIGILHIQRDKRFDSGWITKAKRDDIELAFSDKSYIVPVEFRSRWWVTNRSTRPAQITHVYFQGVGDKRCDREICEFCFLLADGNRVPSAEFENTAHVEVNLWSDSRLLDIHQSAAGYVVFVDHIGNEYRTEPLLYGHQSLTELRD